MSSLNINTQGKSQMKMFHSRSTISKENGGYGDIVINLEHVIAVDIVKKKINGEWAYSIPFILLGGKVMGEAHDKEEIARERFAKILDKMGMANPGTISYDYIIDDTESGNDKDSDRVSTVIDLLKAIKTATK